MIIYYLLMLQCARIKETVKMYSIVAETAMMWLYLAAIVVLRTLSSTRYFPRKHTEAIGTTAIFKKYKVYDITIHAFSI